MATQVQTRAGEQKNAWQWLVNGWHALRDKAVNAVTYFTPQREQEIGAQRWGVLATEIPGMKVHWWSQNVPLAASSALFPCPAVCKARGQKQLTKTASLV